MQGVKRGGCVVGSVIALLFLAGVSFATLGDDMATMQTVDVNELNGMAKSAIPLEKGVLILVGDKKTILKQIEGIVPTPVELDIYGNRVGS